MNNSAVATAATTRRLAWLALTAALLPLLTFNTTYLIAMSQDHVASCFTYVQGCTSVSSTGRQAPEMFIFKPGVLALAVVLAVHWFTAARLLQGWGLSAAKARSLKIIASISVVALSIYAITLGLPDETYRTPRRIGTHGFAVTSWLLQILFVVYYRPLRIEATRLVYLGLVTFVVLLFVIGLISETAKALDYARKMINNIAAWNAFLVLTGYYLVLARLWWLHHKSDGRAASPSE